MITFYPRDIGCWRKHFNFYYPGNPSALSPSLHFHDRQEFINFLKNHGVRLDDANNPLKIELHNATGSHHSLGNHIYDVIQWTILGWLKDDLR